MCHPSKAKRAKDAAERKIQEEGKRKLFEERMIRKAKREGKQDLYFYLNQGSAPHSIEDISALKLLSKEKVVLVVLKFKNSSFE